MSEQLLSELCEAVADLLEEEDQYGDGETFHPGTMARLRDVLARAQKATNQ